ncbi:hypothetical protein FACS1894166_12190 [Bacilli bacterium]|nr:hypothetical protein FACS1894166_12190 [Bacilli bacterium]
MTLTALKNSVNYTGEADLNVLPALMFNGASNMAFIADTVEVRASLKDLNLNG